MKWLSVAWRLFGVAIVAVLIYPTITIEQIAPILGVCIVYDLFIQSVRILSSE